MTQAPYFNFSIDTLILENFRKFDTLTVHFNKQMTALTAPNGGGKSAILHALAIACSHFVWTLQIDPGISNGFRAEDHRMVPQKGGGMVTAGEQMSLTCKGCVGYEDIIWKRIRRAGLNTKTQIGEAGALAKKAIQLQNASAAVDANQDDYVYAPIIAFYDTRRLAREKKLTENKKANMSNRFDGYQDCLAIGSSIRVFKDWFRRTSEQLLLDIFLNEDKLVREETDYISGRHLNIVSTAIEKALKHVQWGNPRWSFQNHCIELTNNHQVTLSLDQLSDGIQNVFCLVADIAHRAVRLNPCCDEKLLSSISGLILIDEVDMYLHPSWQQHIVSILTDIFPRVQFVISTHSPQVLSTLKREQILILREEDEEWHASHPDFNPYALPAGESLLGILNTPPQPRTEEFKDIQNVEKLYRQGKSQEADLLREKLAEKGVTIEERDVAFWKLLAELQQTHHA